MPLQTSFVRVTYRWHRKGGILGHLRSTEIPHKSQEMTVKNSCKLKTLNYIYIYKKNYKSSMTLEKRAKRKDRNKE